MIITRKNTCCCASVLYVVAPLLAVHTYKQSGATLNDVCNWHSAVTAFHLTHASFYPRRFSGRTEKLRRFEVCHRLTTNSARALGSTSAPLRQTDVWLCIFMYQVCGTFMEFRRTWGQIVTHKSYSFKSHRHFPRFRTSRIHAVKHVVNIISQLDGKPDIKMSPWDRPS